jgi:hypothetical protein
MAPCHAELGQVCDICNGKMNKRAKAAITSTVSRFDIARVEADCPGGNAEQETDLERRARQDL